MTDERPDAANENTKAKNWDEVSNRLEDDATEAPIGLEATEGTTGELSEELDVAQTEAKKNYELFLRTQAEMENIKRRAQRDLENAHKFGIKKLVEELVPVFDGLEQGLQIELDETDETLKQMHTGLQLTYNILLDTLNKYGIEQLSPEGQAFNPEHHEAISMVEAEGVAPNTVITVFQKGYILNGRLLRPARVIVAK